MIGNLGPERRRFYNLKSNEELYDPATNARVAFKLSGGVNFSPWSVYKNNSYLTYLPGAQKALRSVPEVIPGSSSINQLPQRPQTQNLPPPTRSLVQLQEQIGSMREGSSPINVPGVGRVTYTQNNQGTWVKTYYIGNKPVEPSKFFEAFRRGGTQSPSQGRDSSSRSSAQVNAKQAGGLITPSKPTRPVPSSFASYENYGQGTLLAIQPIIIERTIPTYSSGTPSIIAFPVPVGVNNINDKLSFSRG